jgi:hypothetical protein
LQFMQEYVRALRFTSTPWRRPFWREGLHQGVRWKRSRALANGASNCR